jgi:glycosyltransferase involved in cell wall biosynthesis
VVLGVNGIRLVTQRSGVARAIESILATMAELEHPFQEVRVYSPKPIDAAVKLPGCAHNVVVPSRLPAGLWEQLVLPRAHGSRDVLFCPSYVIPFFARCPTFLIHHGSYEGYAHARDLFSRWTLFKTGISYPMSARRASVVTTVSAFSRDDMVRHYGVARERVHVVPDGVDTRLFRPIRAAHTLAQWRRQVLGEDVPYLLYVGKPTRRRNLPNLLQAFARLKSRARLPHKLLLIGTSLPGISFDPLIVQLGLQDEVVKVGYSSHADMVLAYNAAAVMVYPSSYEGFGMPVLEAMACGTPVIALDNTAFPEFAGGVAMLLPNADVDTLEKGIADLLADERRRAQMAVEGPRRAAGYDWRIVTRRYLDLMLPLVGASPRAA